MFQPDGAVLVEGFFEDAAVTGLAVALLPGVLLIQHPAAPPVEQVIDKGFEDAAETDCGGEYGEVCDSQNGTPGASSPTGGRVKAQGYPRGALSGRKVAASPGAT